MMKLNIQRFAPDGEATYKKMDMGNGTPIQVESAIRDGNGWVIDTHYIKTTSDFVYKVGYMEDALVMDENNESARLNDLDDDVRENTQKLDDLELIKSYQTVGETPVLIGVKSAVNNYTLNNNGLTIGNTIINSTGINYADSVKLGTSGNKIGNLEIYDEFKYGKESINDTPLYIAMVYTNSNNEVGVGHFYNGS